MIQPLLWFDDDTLTLYRITVRRMTIGDAVAMGTMQDAIAKREDLEGRRLLTLSSKYPLLYHATARFARTSLDVAPVITEDGAIIEPEAATWQEIDLTEAEFWNLPDLLLWQWLAAVIERNPQYDTSYETLKKNLMTVLQQNESNKPTTSDGATVNASASS